MDFLQKNIDSGLYSAYQYAFLKDGRLSCGCGGTFSFDSTEKISDTTLFDLASLTKAIVTVPLFYSLFASEKLSPDEKIFSFFKDFKSDITILELLSHISGFPAWLPFYELVSAEKSSEERKKEVETIIFQHETADKTKCYSDLNYLLLGFILEKIFSRPVDAAFKNFKEINKLNFNLTYSPKEKTPKTAFSKTRDTFPEREVEDENCWFLGGKTGHAGLFGSAADVVLYFDRLLKTPWCMPTAEKLGFAGFDRPEGDDSNYGKSAKSRYFGHLGFTGTAFLVDPETKTIAALLTNSTHPTPEKPERKERIKHTRQQFFDSVFLSRERT
ncbi:beta-lactamase family protein [bacterium]|nr:beta-lactamase family protein [bacterium]